MPDPGPLAPQTEAEIHAAAMRAPDARPLTDEEFAGMKRVPRTKTLRRALGLTQAEFAAQFEIPLATLHNWEKGEAEPDQLARAYLKVIAFDAQTVQRALVATPLLPS